MATVGLTDLDSAVLSTGHDHRNTGVELNGAHDASEACQLMSCHWFGEVVGVGLAFLAASLRQILL